MPVLINLGRLLMLGVWAFLLLNLVHPFPRPMNIFVNVALIFTRFHARPADGDAEKRSAERRPADDGLAAAARVYFRRV